jgi:50S ribosomal subunit-associated GTPase HflX
VRPRSSSTAAASARRWRSCASSCATPAREAKRSERKRNTIPSVAIAGYTNAGKSSLLNRLTSAGVLVENALFATLDATVRRAEAATGASTP